MDDPGGLATSSMCTVWTIGHSTRSVDAFMAALDAYGIEAVADVRRFPGSRRHPQFGEAALAGALADHGITYVWLPALGGRRRPLPDSINTAWRNASFRGYADHIATEDFAAGLAELVSIACGLRTAMMCSELLWWRCHRGLIADVLTVLGFEVVHILAENESARHPMTPPARIVGGALTYSE